MFSNKADRQRIEEQEQLIRQAKDYIEKLQDERQKNQQEIASWEGGRRFMLSQLEGAWEVPVRLAESPTGTRVVATLEPIFDEEGSQAAPALLSFSLQSAFAERARLEEVNQSGWALVRAWPINLPGGVDALPGYNSDRYVVCALTSISLWEAGQRDDSASMSMPSPRPAKGGSNFEFRA
jgi:hypothetical protein